MPEEEKQNTAGSGVESAKMNLRNLENIEVKLTVVAGSVKTTLADLMKLNEGSIIDLHGSPGDHLEVMINGKLFGKGEIVLVGESLGVVFSEVNSFEERLRNL